LLNIATYNILHGRYAGMILENLKFLLEKGADIICLQEADLPFEKPLNELLQTPAFKNWRVQYAHTGVGGNLATIWDGTRLQFQNSEILLLPSLPKPAISQRLTFRTNVRQRVGLVSNFLFENKVVRVTNVHLAWEGGIRQRLAQLSYVRNALANEEASYDILAGDFNLLPTRALRRIEEKKIGATLGQLYTNALPNIKWNFDTSYTAPEDGLETVANICRAFGITFRCRLDYIFTRNLKTISGEMFDLPGSDHRPLLAKFDFR